MPNVNPHDTAARLKASLELAEREARRQEREQSLREYGPTIDRAAALLDFRDRVRCAAPGQSIALPPGFTLDDLLDHLALHGLSDHVVGLRGPGSPDTMVRRYPEGRVVAADANPKHAAGRAKPAMRHVPPSALFALGAVMAGGADKYGAYNWCEAGVSATVYYDAAMRHLAAWLQGADRDPESGEHPLAHVMACCAIVLDAHALGVLADDRPKATAHPFAATNNGPGLTDAD